METDWTTHEIALGLHTFTARLDAVRQSNDAVLRRFRDLEYRIADLIDDTRRIAVRITERSAR